MITEEEIIKLMLIDMNLNHLIYHHHCTLDDTIWIKVGDFGGDYQLIDISFDTYQKFKRELSLNILLE